MKHNLDKLNILRNESLYLMNQNDEKITFYIPTLRDYVEDENLTLFFAARDLDWKSVELNRDFKNYYELMIFMAFNDLYTEPIISTIYKFIPDSKVRDTGIFVNDYKLTYEEFAFITDSWLVCMGAKKLDEMIGIGEPEEELDPIMQKIKASEEKIKKIRQKNQESKEGGLELDKLIIAIIKEFNLSMKEVWDSNLFTIMWYYEYALRLNNYRINTIAFGNGLIKKHKYFIE